MQVGKLYNSLCTPAQLYFVLSVISILALLMQNCSSSRTYTVGRYTVPLEATNVPVYGRTDLGHDSIVPVLINPA